MPPDDRGFVVNVCLTGVVPSKADNPHVPITPEEIAADCDRCMAQGASIFHVHARDDRGEPEWRTERFSEILGAIRARRPEAILCVTTSGRWVGEVEKRMAALDAEPRPEMASLTLGSLNFKDQASVNDPATIERLARAMQGRGIVPELEIFEVGMARYASHLVAQGVLRPPLYANVLLGNVASAGVHPADLAAILRELPEGTMWCAGGIGRAQLPAATLGLLFGDGVRIGLEDNLRLPGDSPATNPDLVERIVQVGRLLGRQPIAPEELRARLRLTGAPGRVRSR
jgi:3-keto-5-aminohexanoate cleavage enzyme